MKWGRLARIGRAEEGPLPGIPGSAIMLPNPQASVLTAEPQQSSTGTRVGVLKRRDHRLTREDAGRPLRSPTIQTTGDTVGEALGSGQTRVTV